MTKPTPAEIESALAVIRAATDAGDVTAEQILTMSDAELAERGIGPDQMIAAAARSGRVTPEAGS